MVVDLLGTWLVGVKVGVRTPYAARGVEPVSCEAGAPPSGEAATQLAACAQGDAGCARADSR